jgi:hypothetical protein
MHKHEFETTYRVFRNIFKIAKKRRPFCDLPDDIEMQILNGINMGRVFTVIIHLQILSNTAGEMKKKIAENITNKRKIYVSIDE